MGSYSLDEFENTGTQTSAGSLSVDNAQNLAESHPVTYTAPEEKPTGNIVAGVAKGIASTPQVLGSFLSYLGHNFDPSASEDQIRAGNSFGDRMARLGIEMTEKNKRYLAEHFPQSPNLWQKIGEGVGGALPLAATIGVGMLTGADEAALTAIAAGGVFSTTNASTFEALKQQGKSTLSADLMSLVPAGAAGALTMLGFGNFLRAAGGPLEQLAKGAFNGYATMLAQSSASGEIQHAMGVNQGALVDRLSKYAIDGVVGAILGGPMGVYKSLELHGKIESELQQFGATPEQAKDMATVVMSKMMGKGLDISEQMTGNKAQDESRLNSLDEKGNPMLERKGIPEDMFYPGVEKAPLPTDIAVQSTQGNKYVILKPIDLQIKVGEKATATDIRERFVGGRDEQIRRIFNLGEDMKINVPDKIEQGGMFLSQAPKEQLQLALENPEECAEILQREVHVLSGTKEPFELDEDLVKTFVEKVAKYKAEIEKAGALSPEAQAALKEGQIYYKEAGDVAAALGTIHQAREDYFSNRLYAKETPQDYLKIQAKTGLSQFSWHSLQRFYENPLQALAMGKDFQTINYADLLTLHGQDMARVNANRQLADAMTDLKPIKLGTWVNPFRTPEGWKAVGDIRKDVPLHEQDGTPKLDENSNQLYAHFVFAAPEGIAKGLEALTQQDLLKQIPGVITIQKLQGIAKTGLLSYSFFHHFTFMTQILASANGWKTLADFPSALKDRVMTSEGFRNTELDFIRHTGTTSALHEVQDIMGGLEKGDDAIAKVLNAPVAKQLGQLSKASTNFLFGQMQRYFKVMTYAKNVSAWEETHPEATEAELRDVKVGFAKSTNANFGGLNWEALGVTRTMQSVYRMFLLAPDWVGSMALNTRYAFTQGGTQGLQSRVTLATAAIGGLIAGDTVNYLMTGHHMFDNKKGHHFEVEIAPDVYVSPVRGAPGELIKAMADVIESGGAKGAQRYMEGKLSPGMSAFVTGISGVNYYGGNIWKGKTPLQQNVNGFWNIMSHLMPVPIGATGAVSYAQREREQSALGWGSVATGFGRFSKAGGGKQKSWESQLKMDLFKSQWMKRGWEANQ